MKDKARFGWWLPCVASLLTACTGNIESEINPSGQDEPRISDQSGENEFGSEPNDRSPVANEDVANEDVTNEELAADGVKIELQKIHAGGSVISFGVPVANGALQSAKTVQVLANGKPLDAKVRELLAYYDGKGALRGIAAIQVQFPANLMQTDRLLLELRWRGGNPQSTGMLAYSNVSVDAPVLVKTVVRTITSSAGEFRLSESSPQTKTLFTAREPNVIAHFPDGYLASTQLLGFQVTAKQLRSQDNPATGFLSEHFYSFGLSSMYADGYAYHPAADSVSDLESDYSAWLYDRCATYLGAFVHFGDARFSQFGQKSCAYFAKRIGLSGATLGIFTGKPTADAKYSHSRGLYAYYAMTGDEQARAAGTAIADMWLNDTLFVQPYRQGHVRGPEKLWTERLLAASLEGLLYGYRFTGDTRYLTAFSEMLGTAHRHVTGTSAELLAINPGVNFPPQNCFIHSGLQQSEATASDPWCSPWMSELLVDPLLQYQALTNDSRVDEIFIRLARFLRDVGTSYFTTDPLDDTFMSPSVCDDPSAGGHRRRLVPLYGAGLNASGTRINKGEWSDFEHCADATALSAAALRALKRTGQYDKNPLGPFKSEGESILQLHHELLSCAERTFEEETRPKRNPAAWTSAELAAGAADPANFIDSNKIGYPAHMQEPARKLSWWFNTSMQQFSLLAEVGIRIDTLRPGAIQPANCK